MTKIYKTTLHQLRSQVEEIEILDNIRGGGDGTITVGSSTAVDALGSSLGITAVGKTYSLGGPKPQDPGSGRNP